MSNLPLLTTHGITDPQTRAFLDRFLAVWNEKMNGQDALVSRSEFPDLTADALLKALAGGGNGAGLNQSINDALNQLTQAIRQSLVYQVLEENIQPRIDRLLQDTQRRAATAASGLATETETRANHMESLASSINNIWASIGGSTAVIEEGELASATPSSAVADRWNSVVAAVTDPDTGLVSSASILTETRAFADDANNTFNAIYSVKAVVAAGGATVAGGFALAATTGAGSAQGPTIDFGILANKFFIAAPSSSYNPATEYTANTQFPFIVVTTPTTINGKTYPAGVYMKRAAIGQAAIGTAEIEDASIVNAKISGTISSGSWSGPGGVGWAIEKTTDNAYFNNIYARGNIEASSVTANTITTTNIVGAAVSTNASSTGTSTCSISISAPAGSSTLVILADPSSLFDTGSGMWSQNRGTLTINGTDVITTKPGFIQHTIDNPSGSYTIVLSSIQAAGSSASGVPVSIAALLTKR